MQEETVAAVDTENEDDAPTGPETDYDYLLGMTLWTLTTEKKNQLLKKRDEKYAELEVLRKRAPSDLWIEDLNALLEKVRTRLNIGSNLQTRKCRAVRIRLAGLS